MLKIRFGNKLNKIQRGCLFGALLLSFTTPLMAMETAREIMQQVKDRNDGDTQISSQILTTCRYAIQAKKLVCAETPRVKKIEAVRKDFGPKGHDKKAVSIILEPASEKGIAFLQYDYDDPDHDADQWMYMSALGKVKRIVSGNDDEPKKGSFFGSEFSYEDLEQPHLDDYRYRILKSVNYRGRDCWVIESIPTPERARKSNYSKSIIWIDKERLLELKVMLYDRQGQKIKRITARKIEQLNGIWGAHYLNVNNLQTKRMSTFELRNTKYNIQINDEFLTLRTLNDAAFRDSQLRQYEQAIGGE